MHFFFFSELCSFFDLDFLSSIKHPTAERWHQYAVLLLKILFLNLLFLNCVFTTLEQKSFQNIVGKGNSPFPTAPPGWLSGELVGLMTWWLRVRSPVEATFLSGVFSPLTSAEACEKSSRWLWKEKLC